MITRDGVNVKPKQDADCPFALKFSILLFSYQDVCAVPFLYAFCLVFVNENMYKFCNRTQAESCSGTVRGPGK